MGLTVNADALCANCFRPSRRPRARLPRAPHVGLVVSCGSLPRPADGAVVPCATQVPSTPSDAFLRPPLATHCQREWRPVLAVANGQIVLPAP